MTEVYPNQETVDAVFGILAHHRRRCALRTLQAYENPMALADLADEVAVQEKDTPITEISPEEVQQVYLDLYHTHIPKLEDEQFVHYDQEQDYVSLSERSEYLEQYQDLLTIDSQ